jgi:hypothetical protein
MYVQDLYAIIDAHWTMDAKPRHGRFRVQMGAILLLSGATATRPQALVESSSARGSNKALSYEHITILKVRDAKNFNQTTTVALVSLVHIKNSGGTGRRYVATPIKDGANGANRPVVRGSFSVLKASQLFVFYPIS